MTWTERLCIWWYVFRQRLVHQLPAHPQSQIRPVHQVADPLLPHMRMDRDSFSVPYMCLMPDLILETSSRLSLT
jgi:hypothetical protein